jgi:hypothetical protein
MLGTWKRFILPGALGRGRRRAVETEPLSLPRSEGEQVGWATFPYDPKGYQEEGSGDGLVWILESSRDCGFGAESKNVTLL